MRICQIAPLAESVPPKLYGGTERVVAWLIDELVSLGHEVTLFASGDSVTMARLNAVASRSSPWPATHGSNGGSSGLAGRSGTNSG
jgi:hypothetical protein